MKRVDIKAEMNALVIELVLKPGDAVKEGDTILLLQSMKMEIPVYATTSGTLLELKVVEEQAVQEGDDLAVIGFQ